MVFSEYFLIFPLKSQIKLLLNGNYALFLYMKLTKNLQMGELEGIVKEKWKKKINRFRLFTSDGLKF